MGVLASILAACGQKKLDADAVSVKLQGAAEVAEGYISGTLSYTDDSSTGQQIGGTLVVAGDDEAAVGASLDEILSAAAKAVADVDFPKTTEVTVAAHPQGGNDVWVAAKDVIALPDGATPRVTDLLEHYGY